MILCVICLVCVHCCLIVCLFAFGGCSGCDWCVLVVWCFMGVFGIVVALGCLMFVVGCFGVVFFGRLLFWLCLVYRCCLLMFRVGFVVVVRC